MYICRNEEQSTKELTVIELHDVIAGEYRMTQGVQPVQHVTVPNWLGNEAVVQRLLAQSFNMGPLVEFGANLEMLDNFVVTLIMKISAVFNHEPRYFNDEYPVRASYCGYRPSDLQIAIWCPEDREAVLQLVTQHLEDPDYQLIAEHMHVPVLVRSEPDDIEGLDHLLLPWDLSTAMGRRLAAEAQLSDRYWAENND